MLSRKAVVKPTAGRPRAVLGNISNKAAPAARADGTKVVSDVHFLSQLMNISYCVIVSCSHLLTILGQLRERVGMITNLGGE